MLDATPFGVGLGRVDAASDRGRASTYVNDGRSARLRPAEVMRDIAQSTRSAEQGMEAGRDTPWAARPPRSAKRVISRI